MGFCQGACTPGEGHPIAPPSTARAHFCKSHDLFQLRIASFCYLFILPRCLYAAFRAGPKAGASLPKQLQWWWFPLYFLSQQVNKWFVWGNLNNAILSTELFLWLVTSKSASLLPPSTSGWCEAYKAWQQAQGLWAGPCFGLKGEGGGVPKELKWHLSLLHHPQSACLGLDHARISELSSI